MNDSPTKEKFYIPVYPQILRVDSILSFDIFAKNSDGGFVLFHPAGELYSSETHAKIYKWNIPLLYIKTSDKVRYNHYLEENFQSIMYDPLITTERKAEIAHVTVTGIAMSLFTSPGADIIASYKKTIYIIIQYVLSNEEGIKFLIKQTSSSFHEYNHAVNVGVFGLGLAKEIFGNDSPHNMVEITHGFFLHDIGKYTIPRHIRKRNGTLTPEEWAIMKKHPEQGYKILQTFNALSEEISLIVLQHHERNDGKGYPEGLKSKRIHMYSKICSFADVFDALTSQRPYRSTKSSFNALIVMQNEMKNEFDSDFFAHFVKLFSRM
jgi:HD-GYP domain-containing protein (c-di-GMP phosphodiesterase class II)